MPRVAACIISITLDFVVGADSVEMTSANPPISTIQTIHPQTRASTGSQAKLPYLSGNTA